MEFMKSNFVTEAILSQLRSENYPTEKQVASLDRQPLINLLRQQVLATDTSWLLRLVSHESSKIAGLACSLLRHHMNDTQVQRSLENRWSVASPYLKNRLMWRLLDVSELPSSWRTVFVEFIKSKWEIFCEFNQDFFTPSHDALSQIASRLLDPSFPETKKWVYLYCIPSVHAAPSLAKAVLTLGLTVRDEFAQGLAKELLQNDGWRPFVASTINSAGAGLDLTFIAQAVVTAFRQGKTSGETESDWLNRLPIIDELRARIERADLEWIWPVIENKNGERAGLFASLLRKYSCEADVQSRLRSKWTTAEPFLRAHLMWRILDDPDLPNNWHEKLFEFVLAEWDTFQKVSLKFLGIPATVVTQVLKRIADPSFPECKKWAYLCRVPQVAEDQEAAKALVNIGSLIGNEFTQKAANELLRRFFANPPVHETITPGSL